MLEVIALITFHKLHLHPVFYRCCTQTQLKGQTEETRLRDPSELLIFGMRITSIHCYKGGTLHLYALVVIFIENQEATRVWSRAKRKFSNTFPWDMFFKWSHKCINQQKCFCVTYLYQRWCRGLEGHRGPQQNLNRATLSLCSSVTVGRGCSRDFPSWAKGSGICKGVWHGATVIQRLSSFPF